MTKKSLDKEDIPQFKHVRIAEHPLKNEYMVVNVTFPQIPPYFGTLKQCVHAAEASDKNSELLMQCNGDYNEYKKKKKLK